MSLNSSLASKNSISLSAAPEGVPDSSSSRRGHTMLRKLALFALSISCLALGSSFSMKAAIGVGPYDAIAQTLSFITKWKVGIFYIALNLFWLGLHLFMRKRWWDPVLYSQLFLIFGFGFLLDFFYYHVLGSFTLHAYPLRFLFLCLALLFASFGIALLLSLNFIAPPLESFFMEVCARLQKNFGRLRQLVDLGFIAASSLLTLLFSVEWTVREGTVFSALCFGPLIAFFLPLSKHIARKFLGEHPFSPEI